MWTQRQLERLSLEHALFQHEGMNQFGVWYLRESGTYSASGIATSSSGRKYDLYMDVPSGFPEERPPLYLTAPRPLLGANGQPISALGVSHAMHTLTPSPNGSIQVCHWRDNRWHAGIFLYQVFLKGLIWIEAYEQHLATGRPISEFVRSMPEAA